MSLYNRSSSFGVDVSEFDDNNVRDNVLNFHIIMESREEAMGG